MILGIFSKVRNRKQTQITVGNQLDHHPQLCVCYKFKDSSTLVPTPNRDYPVTSNHITDFLS